MALYPYFERQEGSLCAQHAINVLMQESMFTAIDLAEIAQGLDAIERQTMAEAGTDTKEYLTFMAADSSNYDDSGFFSSQVIGKALENLGLEMTPITHPDMATAKANPLQEVALICWLSSHWFTIRKIGGQQWWNLNSQLQQPERVSDTYLAMLIHQLTTEGYTVFVVRGAIPQPPAIAQPLPSSLSYAVGGSSGGSMMDMDPDLARAIAASMGDMQQASGGGGGGGGGGNAAVVIVDDDDDAAAAAGQDDDEEEE